VTSYGQLGAFASTTWNNPNNAALSDSAITDAGVNDVLHFSGMSSGSISFTYLLSGTSTQSLVGAGSSEYWLAIRSPSFGNAIWTNTAPPSSVTLTALFSGGTLAYTLQLEAEVRTGNVQGTLNETVDFLHTATLSGVQVFNSAGNPVSTVITADSGFGYQALTGVPEPASYGTSCLGVGFLACLRVWRQRVRY
jgi:hypothetical protein